MGPLDILELTGPAFFSLAYRLPAYDGVMTARLMADDSTNQPQARGSGTARRVDSSQAAIVATPELSSLIEF